jgi:hypothetical protein
VNRKRYLIPTDTLVRGGNTHEYDNELSEGEIRLSDAKANEPTPWIGVWERINIGVYMLWVVVLAIALLRDQVKRPQGDPY